MQTLHARVAQVGLAAIAHHGFALAGGYAVQAHGLLSRMSEDVDLFTNLGDKEAFAEAVRLAGLAWSADGLQVTLSMSHDTFARFDVTDESGTSTKVELGYDWRANPPAQFSIGPVLHLDDAVANKMSALFGRAYARDYLDVHAALRSGLYSPQRLLTIAGERDAGFNAPMFADALSASTRFEDHEYLRYGVTTEQVATMRADPLAWAAELRELPRQRDH